MSNQPTPERVMQSLENLQNHRGPYADFEGCQNKCNRKCVTIACLVHPDWLPRLEAVASGAGFNSVNKLLSFLLMKHAMGIDRDKQGFCQPLNEAEETQINKPYNRGPGSLKDSLRRLETHGDKYSDFDGCVLECERHCVIVTVNVHPEWLPRLEDMHDCFASDSVGGIVGCLVQKYVLGVDPFKVGHMCQPIFKAKDPDPLLEALPSI